MFDPAMAKRVARRFIAGEALDEKMKALLLKLRKGADASLSQKQLFKVLDLLGGWRVEQIIGLVPMHYVHDGKEHKESYAEENEEAARAKYDKLKSEVVPHLPSEPQQGKQYVMDLEPLKSWENQFAKGGKYHGTKYNAWVGCQGYRITDPKGAVFEMLPSRWDLERPSGQDRKKLTLYDAMRWLKAHTTYLPQINELLGMEEHVPAEQRTRENTGTCGACFRNIKLVRKGDDVVLMALHGYNRPGHGYVIGKCWGGEHEPYELGTSATKKMWEAGDARVASIEKYIQHLQSPTLTEFDEHYWWGSNPKILKKEGTVYWDHALKEHIETSQKKLGDAEDERDIYKHLVEHWKLADLPTAGSKEVDWFGLAARAVGAKKRV
jgi:hypothetical protein